MISVVLDAASVMMPPAVNLHTLPGRTSIKFQGGGNVMLFEQHFLHRFTRRDLC